MIQSSNEYNVGRELGHGGFGTVFEITQKTTSHKFAMKVIPLSGFSIAQVLAITKEFTVAQKLKHKNFLEIYNYFEEHNPDDENESKYHLIMELAEGTLISLLQKWTKEIDWQFTYKKEIFNICQQLIEAVAFMHQQGIIHRDLKPDNVLFVHENGQIIIKLCDFGTAKNLTKTNTTAGAGTQCYMSPEMIMNGQSSQSSDIWAIGCTIYEICTAEKAFPGVGIQDIIDIKYNIELVPYPQLKYIIQQILIRDVSFRVTTQQLLENFQSLISTTLQQTNQKNLATKQQQVFRFPKLSTENLQRTVSNNNYLDQQVEVQNILETYNRMQNNPQQYAQKHQRCHSNPFFIIKYIGCIRIISFLMWLTSMGLLATIIVSIRYNFNIPFSLCGGDSLCQANINTVLISSIVPCGLIFVVTFIIVVILLQSCGCQKYGCQICYPFIVCKCCDIGCHKCQTIYGCHHCIYTLPFNIESMKLQQLYNEVDEMYQKQIDLKIIDQNIDKILNQKYDLQTSMLCNRPNPYKIMRFFWCIRLQYLLIIVLVVISLILVIIIVSDCLTTGNYWSYNCLSKYTGAFVILGTIPCIISLLMLCLFILQCYCGCHQYCCLICCPCQSSCCDNDYNRLPSNLSNTDINVLSNQIDELYKNKLPQRVINDTIEKLMTDK